MSNNQLGGNKSNGIFSNSSATGGGNIFNNAASGTTGTAGNLGLFNKPTGGGFGQNQPQVAGNIFGNQSNPSSTSGNLFGNNQNTQSQPTTTAQGNNIFGGGNKAAQTPNMFGNKPGQNKPAVGGLNLLQNQQINAQQGSNQPATSSVNLFTQNNAAQQKNGGLFGANVTTINTGADKKENPPKGNMFANQTGNTSGTNAQVTQPVGGILFGNQGNTQNNTATNQPTTGNVLGVKPAQNTSQQPNTQDSKPVIGSASTMGGNIFGNANTTAAKQPQVQATSPATGGVFNNSSSATTVGMFNNAANKPTEQPAGTTANQPTVQPGNNLFGSNNANKPATTTTTTPPPPGNNLFNNATQNPVQSTNPATTANTAGTGGTFGNNAAQSQQGVPNTTQQQGANQPVTGQQPALNQQVQPQSLKSVAQMQFDKNSSKTVKQFVNNCRTQMDQMYSQINKYSNNLLRYQQDREENMKIYRNFEQIKPEFLTNSDLNNRILTNIENQQDQIQKNLNFILQQIGAQRSDHPLATCLKSYWDLNKQVIELQAQSQNTGNQSGEIHPSHEQLMLLYSSLDKVQTQVDSMNQLLQICFGKFSNNQNSLYGSNNNYGLNRY